MLLSSYVCKWCKWLYIVRSFLSLVLNMCEIEVRLEMLLEKAEEPHKNSTRWIRRPTRQTYQGLNSRKLTDSAKGWAEICPQINVLLWLDQLNILYMKNSAFSSKTWSISFLTMKIRSRQKLASRYFYCSIVQTQVTRRFKWPRSDEILNFWSYREVGSSMRLGLHWKKKSCSIFAPPSAHVSLVTSKQE